MAYNELIKNFETIRAYMQDFYIYGFKTRNEYDRRSGRSYDDERRRIESWLGDHVHYAMTPEGKKHIPFYRQKSRHLQQSFRTPPVRNGVWLGKTQTAMDSYNFRLLEKPGLLRAWV